jgi:hypothetical protein
MDRERISHAERKGAENAALFFAPSREVILVSGFGLHFAHVLSGGPVVPIMYFIVKMVLTSLEGC